MTRRLQACGALLAAIVALGGARAAAAPPRVALHMRFHPDRPGASTTISFGFQVGRPTPLRAVRLRLPAGMGFATATLGFATCEIAVFRLEGGKGCPANSRVGYGTAYAQAPFVEEGRAKNVYETASVSVFFGPIEGGAQTVLFWIEGNFPASYWQPVVARALPASPPYGESLAMELPLFSAAAEGPYVALRSFKATIGPDAVTYYLHEHGRAIPFKPRGVAVPDRCPRGGGLGGVGGYPVQASFTWWGLEGTSTARTRVACPRGGPDARHARRARRRGHARGERGGAPSSALVVVYSRCDGSGSGISLRAML